MCDDALGLSEQLALCIVASRQAHKILERPLRYLTLLILAIGAGTRCQSQITNITPGGTERLTGLARRIHQFKRGI